MQGQAGALRRNRASMHSRPDAQAPSAEVLAPMLAGAHARGLADAFEMMGYGVVMLDASGRVLFASERARKDGQGVFRIASDHVLGASAHINGILSRLISGGFENQWIDVTTEDVAGAGAEEAGRQVALQCLRGPSGEDREIQLLDKIVLVKAL